MQGATQQTASHNGSQPGKSGLLRSFLVGSSEVLLAIGLVLGLALVFVGVLLLCFPNGGGLTYFYDKVAEQGGRESRLKVDSTYSTPDLVATLVSVQRDVRDRPANAIAWSSSSAGDALQDHHTVQTMAGSGAGINIQSSGSLELGEKSLVVIKRPEGRRRKSRKASLVLLGGRVRGTLDAEGGAAQPIQLVTPGGTTELLADASQPADFSLEVGEDNTSTLSVFSGIAEIQTPDGIKQIAANQAVMIPMDGTISEAVDLPDTPNLQLPPDGDVQVFGAIAPRVEFAWDDVRQDAEYRLTLARDPELTEVVHVEETGDTQFQHGNLDAGTYYWQVRSLAGTAESLPSPVFRLELVADREPPPLQINLPETVSGLELEIVGQTEPGSEAFIGNELVPVDPDGTFTYLATLKRGLNMIVVEVIDSAGNSSYSTQYVTATGRPQP